MTVQTHELVAHPGFPPLEVSRVAAVVLQVRDGWLQMRWRIEGAGAVVLPPLAGRRRADRLWQTTCFELFVADGGERYAEFNFSPSEAWAAYDFAAYREGMRERAVARPPVSSCHRGRSGLALFDAAIRRAAIPADGPIGLSAVIEEAGGRKSYWALAHPPGDPDFHHRACFAATLAATELA